MDRYVYLYKYMTYVIIKKEKTTELNLLQAPYHLGLKWNKQ